LINAVIHVVRGQEDPAPSPFVPRG
jgi:hypothetical protein